MWLHLFPGAGTGYRQLVSYNTQKTKMRGQDNKGCVYGSELLDKVKKKQKLETTT